MANGESLTIDGNGSVRWQAINVQDDVSKGEMAPHGQTGRRTKGVDKLHGDYFRVEIKVPDVWTAQFVAQFAGAAGKQAGDTIVIYLPIREIDKQIDVHWTPGLQPPGGGLTGS